MLVTKDRLLYLCAPACHNVPLTTLLPASANPRHINEWPAGPAKASQRSTVSQRQALPEQPTVSGRPTAFRRPLIPQQPSVVVPRPEDRGICFSSARGPQASLGFNTLRTLFPARKPQPKQFQRLTNSSLFAKDITRAFPASYPLFPRFAAPERNATTVFSCSCTLFRKNTRGRGAGDSEFRKPPAPLGSVVIPGPEGRGICFSVHASRMPLLFSATCELFFPPEDLNRNSFKDLLTLRSLPKT